MGVTNFDNLPENQATTRLRDNRQLLRERKGSNQRISGASLRYFRSPISAQPDWTGRADTPSPQAADFGGAGLEITLTAENAVVPLLDVAVEMYSSTDGTIWRRYSIEDEMTRVEPLISHGLWPLAGALNEPRQAKWLIFISARQNTHIGFKLQTSSTDRVTASFRRTI